MGGTSSLAPGICKLAFNSGYEVHATHRHPTPPMEQRSVFWHYLELVSIKSIEIFIEDLGDLTFSRVIYLAGETSGGAWKEFTTHELAEYLLTQLIHPVNLIGRLIKFLNVSTPSNFLYMSSRSATFGSADWPYGIAKAGVQNYVTSLSQSVSQQISIISVVSGLIIGSNMQKEMSLSTLTSHRERALAVGEDLLTLDEVVKELWSLDPDSTLNMRGVIKSLGPVY